MILLRFFSNIRVSKMRRKKKKEKQIGFHSVLIFHCFYPIRILKSKEIKGTKSI